MALPRPKPYMFDMQVRQTAEGTEARRNTSKIILERGTPFPKPIEYSDIDQSFFDWVDKTLEITYNGKFLPTYKLFSTQRLAEYSQTWSHLDDAGEIQMNFKTITRESNPQKGTNQGDVFNIPGERDYAVAYVPVLQENGSEAIDLYSMKQPIGVDFIYTLGIVTNKYQLLNEFNEIILHQFQSIDCYLYPNGHPMPMTLESISDESEYQLDDYKYYSQSYKIKLKGYIIRKEDFKITHLPSRLIIRGFEASDGITVKSKGKYRHGRVEPVETLVDPSSAIFKDSDMYASLSGESCDIPSPQFRDLNSLAGVEVYVEDCDCSFIDDNWYYNKTITVDINFDICECEIEFVFDTNMVINEIETTNVTTFDIFVNGEKQDVEAGVRLYPEDDVKIIIRREQNNKEARIKFKGYDPTIILDKRINPESALDEPVTGEELIIEDDEE